MSLRELEKAIKNRPRFQIVRIKDKRFADNTVDVDKIPYPETYEKHWHKVEACFQQHKQQLKDALEKLKQTRDKRYAETDDLSWTLHGAILGIGFVLGTHTLDTILETKGENLLKGVGKEGDK